MLAALTVLVLRGAPMPSRRAFWWFVAGQAMYLPVTMMSQLDEPGIIDARWTTVVYFLGVLPTLRAAVAIRFDAHASHPEHASPTWRFEFNPLAAFVPFGVGVFFMIALLRPTPWAVLPLGMLLLMLTALLGVRLVITQRAGAALRAERERETERLQAAKASAVGRVASGIAHEFNNLMLTVIGTADLGASAPEHNASTREEFDRIRVAGERAAQLTKRLMAVAGHHSAHRRRLNLGTMVREAEAMLAQQAAAARGSRAAVLCTVRAADDVFVHGDGMLLRAAIAELVENAAIVSPDGGTISVMVDRHILPAGAPEAMLPVQPGTYGRVRVHDAGQGIEASALQRAFDPFGPSADAGEGLGLAAVYSIAKFHEGGMMVDSAAGAGTTVALLLPVVDDAPASDSSPLPNESP
jgi:signal transduction histidine kinase